MVSPLDKPAMVTYCQEPGVVTSVDDSLPQEQDNVVQICQLFRKGLPHAARIIGVQGHWKAHQISLFLAVPDKSMRALARTPLLNTSLGDNDYSSPKHSHHDAY
eukprot:1160926-Pelagomonas_calceolata.AAC.1